MARLRYRSATGKRAYKSKAFDTQLEAEEGLSALIAENSDDIRQSQATYFDNLKASSERENKNGPYTCPTCKQERHYRNRRIVRLGGALTAICRTCFNEGRAA